MRLNIVADMSPKRSSSKLPFGKSMSTKSSAELRAVVLAPGSLVTTVGSVLCNKR